MVFTGEHFSLPWYWLVYFIGFFWVFYSVLKLNKLSPDPLSRKDLADYFQWGWLSLFIGARLIYIVVYHPSFFLEHPHMIPKFWLGGMSFHGALLGISVALFLVAKKKKQSFFQFADLLVTAAPLVLAFGRLANFVNGELAGKVSQVPWAVIFPRYKDGLPRHPSQLYQAFVEGFLLFLILQLTKKRFLSLPGMQSSIFLIGYGVLRFLVEFFRAPDPQLGAFLGLNMGQYLCLIMVAVGAWLMKKSLNSPQKVS